MLERCLETEVDCGAVIRNLAFPWSHVNYTRRPVGFPNDFHLSGAAWLRELWRQGKSEEQREAQRAVDMCQVIR